MDRIALGTAQFGMHYGIANKKGQVPVEEAALMVAYASACGISVIDTAIAYGESEACLGQVGVNQFAIVTKLPGVPDNIDISDAADWVRNQVKASINRLRVPRLSGLLIHKPGQLFGPYSTQIKIALFEMQEQGFIEKLGVSIYKPDELEAIGQIFPFEIVQAPFNLLDRRLETSGWLLRLKRLGIEVHFRSVFLQGLLLMPISDIPNEFLRSFNLLHYWSNWLKNNNVTALHTCLAFALSFREVNKVIVGADSLDQLKQLNEININELSLEFPDIASEDLNLIDPSNWKI